MKVPSHTNAFEVLLLQAADNGQGPTLFGDGKNLSVKAARPFMVANQFPNVYLEFPLTGEPFLDVTVLYSEVESGLHVESDNARDTDKKLDWLSGVTSEYEEVFARLRAGHLQSIQAAALRFQPRARKGG